MDTNPLRATLDGWNKDHWIKDSVRQGQRWCLIGRMHYVNHDQWPATLGTLVGVILEQYPERVDPCYSIAELAIGDFNDHELTTFDDVRAVLEKAAVRWEERI